MYKYIEATIEVTTFPTLTTRVVTNYEIHYKILKSANPSIKLSNTMVVQYVVRLIILSRKYLFQYKFQWDKEMMLSVLKKEVNRQHMRADVPELSRD